MKQRVFFDMDGVLFDWVDMYQQRSSLPLEKFNKLSRTEREEIKRTLFDRTFFSEMKPIESGIDLLKFYVDSGYEVSILSATGRVNKAEVIQGKLESVKKWIGDIQVQFVDKVEMKGMFVEYPSDILIDDRRLAIDSWVEAGGYGILFVQS